MIAKFTKLYGKFILRLLRLTKEFSYWFTGKLPWDFIEFKIEKYETFPRNTPGNFTWKVLNSTWCFSCNIFRSRRKSLSCSHELTLRSSTVLFQVFSQLWFQQTQFSVCSWNISSSLFAVKFPGNISSKFLHNFINL